MLLALIAFRLVTSLEPEDFLAWGWRLPFLASGVLMMVGLMIRSGVHESPEFAKARDNNETSKYPVKDVIRTCWRQILFAAAAVTIGSAGFFFTNTFMITYVTQYQGIARTSASRPANHWKWRSGPTKKGHASPRRCSARRCSPGSYNWTHRLRRRPPVWRRGGCVL